MPLFKTRPSSSRFPTSEKTLHGFRHSNHYHQNGENEQENTDANNVSRNQHQENYSASQNEQRRPHNVQKPPLVFHCQLAHGSHTGLISGFTNVRELYQKIAECFDLPVDQILFCTLNTHKTDMTELLGGQIGVGDFIFAHTKGQAKEIELVKNEDALGLTITDNGAGYAFIKRIKEESVIDKIEVIQVGDHLEKIDSTSLVGKRHYEVAKMLKEIPKGATFTLRLVEPLKNGFENIGPRGDLKKGKKVSYSSGRETLRFKADGSTQLMPAMDDAVSIGVEKINAILESYMGIFDTELATQIWELAEGKQNSIDFADAIDSSDLESFGFTDDFLIELWGAITDARAG